MLPPEVFFAKLRPFRCFFINLHDNRNINRNMDLIQAKQLRAYSAQYGAIVGLMWILSFSCYIIGLSEPLVGNLGLLFGVFSFVVAGYLIRHFRRTVFTFGYFRAWRVASLIFIYAALLMAVAQYVYFRYIDQGFLAGVYAEVASRPETRTILEQMFPGYDVAELTEQTVELLRTISPIEITLEFLIYNIILGAILALPAAGIGVSGKGKPLSDK